MIAKSDYISLISVLFVFCKSFLIEKSVFDTVSGFDEGFFLYKEEEDLCLRVRKIGYEVVYIPDIKIIHIGSIVAKRSEHMQKSNEYFLHKHHKKRFDFFFRKLINKLFS